ncbi:MAG: UDP-N-acetylmuramoyl-L-alanine--D-glutamate ligase [Bacteroidales bacterium]|nr:UDP-N-acetylmuramoyl-L-alanine--D-glutamate ligase [Bacteroidales bacterium]
MYRQDQLKSLLEGRRLLIAGHGREGQSTERLLQRLLPEANYDIADGNAQIAAMATEAYDLIVKSPGVPTRIIPPSARPRLTSLTDLFLQVYADQTIGITGTKGKSTTASLIHHLLPGSLLAGNIGIPLFDILDSLSPTSLVVAELSCHQLEILHRSPRTAVLLNLFQEHLDHYDGYPAYKQAKLQIALHQSPTDSLYFSADNPELASEIARVGSSLRGSLHPCSLAALAPGEEQLLRACPLAGEHNRANALVATRVARAIGCLDPEQLAARLATFVGLRHRMERIGEKAGLTWYDDSISTIPEATLAAVSALGRVSTLILGGFDRGIDYSPLVPLLRSQRVGRVVFVGAAGRRMKQLCPDLQLECLVADDYQQIVSWCAANTPAGGTVLLSPAAASYDAFRNFEERGDRFRQLIDQL